MVFTYIVPGAAKAIVGAVYNGVNPVIGTSVSRVIIVVDAACLKRASRVAAAAESNIHHGVAKAAVAYLCLQGGGKQ